MSKFHTKTISSNSSSFPKNHTSISRWTILSLIPASDSLPSGNQYRTAGGTAPPHMHTQESNHETKRIRCCFLVLLYRKIQILAKSFLVQFRVVLARFGAELISLIFLTSCSCRDHWFHCRWCENRRGNLGSTVRWRKWEVIYENSFKIWIEKVFNFIVSSSTIIKQYIVLYLPS